MSYLPLTIQWIPVCKKKRESSRVGGLSFEKFQKALWGAIRYNVERIRYDIHL